MAILVCPLCRSSLTIAVEHEDDGEIVTGTLRCTSCGETYPIEDTIPNLLPPEFREGKAVS